MKPTLQVQSEQPELRHQNDVGGNDFYDLVCVGFGPASLSIAVALHDCGIDARVLFLERQRQFAWHSGMMIPSSRMQISFMKDLATFRDPRSHFTFLNYLKHKGRLEAFTNLGTFYPLREEFNDYLKWAAEHFEDRVRYGTDVVSVVPAATQDNQIVDGWNVLAVNIDTQSSSSYRTRNVVVAIGGVPKIPRPLQGLGPKVVHSSQYLKVVPDFLARQFGEPRVAVIGGGQSAAEVFEDVITNYPHAYTTLFISGMALRPSDDSPFVNEIFNADQVDEFYALGASEREKTVAANRATNYSVVRTELIDRLYDKMYHQRLRNSDERKWRHRIIGSRQLIAARQSESGNINLTFVDPRSQDQDIKEGNFDMVICGTGYDRNAHERILQPLQGLLEASLNSVSRDYRLRMKAGSVAENCGIWLQGCCEDSHGLSDTLLSLLAIRGGEIVNSIFSEAEVVSKHTSSFRARL